MKHLINKPQVMFDLETLSCNTDAIIGQIAAVKFVINEDFSFDILQELDIKVDINSYPETSPFKVDKGTLMWWFNQSSEAIKQVWNSSDRMSIQDALQFFNTFSKEFNKYSHSSYDAPIIQYHYNYFKPEEDTRAKYFIDVNTLKMLAKVVNSDIKRSGTHHNALDDCIFQVELIAKCYEKLLT